MTSIKPWLLVLVLLLAIPAGAAGPRAGDDGSDGAGGDDGRAGGKDKQDKDRDGDGAGDSRGPRAKIEVRLTLQSREMPAFTWELNRQVACQGCPPELANADSILAPGDFPSARNAYGCQVFVWTGEKPRLDTRPILGIVYVYPECLISWGGLA